jgi:hypothetical protein
MKNFARNERVNTSLPGLSDGRMDRTVVMARDTRLAGARGIVVALANIAAAGAVILAGIDLAATFLAPGLDLAGAAHAGLGLEYVGVGVAVLAAGLRFGRSLVARLHPRTERSAIPAFAPPIADARPVIAATPAGAGYRARHLHAA